MPMALRQRAPTEYRVHQRQLLVVLDLLLVLVLNEHRQHLVHVVRLGFVGVKAHSLESHVLVQPFGGKDSAHYGFLAITLLLQS